MSSQCRGAIMVVSPPRHSERRRGFRCRRESECGRGSIATDHSIDIARLGGKSGQGALMNEVRVINLKCADFPLDVFLHVVESPLNMMCSYVPIRLSDHRHRVLTIVLKHGKLGDVQTPDQIGRAHV